MSTIKSGPFTHCCQCGKPKEQNANYQDDCGIVGHQRPYCAKCGGDKTADRNWVHKECLAPGSSPWRS